MISTDKVWMRACLKLFCEVSKNLFPCWFIFVLSCWLRDWLVVDSVRWTKMQHDWITNFFISRINFLVPLLPSVFVATLIIVCQTGTVNKCCCRKKKKNKQTPSKTSAKTFFTRRFQTWVLQTRSSFDITIKLFYTNVRQVTKFKTCGKTLLQECANE